MKPCWRSALGRRLAWLLCLESKSNYAGKKEEKLNIDRRIYEEGTPRYQAAEKYDIGEFLVKLLCETMNNESKRLLSLEEAV